MHLNPTKLHSFATELEKIAIDLDPQLVTALLGAGAAGYGGYKLTKDPRAKARNAVLGALVGGGLGYGLGGEFFPEETKSPSQIVGEASSAQRKALRDAKSRVDAAIMERLRAEQAAGLVPNMARSPSLGDVGGGGVASLDWRTPR